MLKGILLLCLWIVRMVFNEIWSLAMNIRLFLNFVMHIINHTSFFLQGFVRHSDL